MDKVCRNGLLLFAIFLPCQYVPLCQNLGRSSDAINDDLNYLDTIIVGYTA